LLSVISFLCSLDSYRTCSLVLVSVQGILIIHGFFCPEHVGVHGKEEANNLAVLAPVGGQPRHVIKYLVKLCEIKREKERV
jgi:hypothetical protein